jgi:hypothetical protein
MLLTDIHATEPYSVDMLIYCQEMREYYDNKQRYIESLPIFLNAGYRQCWAARTKNYFIVHHLRTKVLERLQKEADAACAYITYIE